MGFYRARLEGICHLLSKNSISLLRPEFLAAASIHLASIHLLSQNSIPFTGELARIFFFSFFWHQVRTSSDGDLRPKNWNSFFLFPLRKRALLPALEFWPTIWPLSSSSTSPSHAIHSGYYTDLSIPFSVQLGQSVGSSWLSFWPGFLTSFNRQAKELTYIPIPLLTVNLWGLLIQTRRGRRNWSYLSPLSGRPRDNVKIRIGI